MSQELYDPAKVTEYRKAATKLHELSRDVEARITGAVDSGDIQSARDALAELKTTGDAFKELRAKLTPTDLFIAKYNIQVHSSHEVSFVLPKGVSRYEMLCEAQGVVAERNRRNLVYPDDLKKWENEDAFKASCTTPERIRIDGHVKGGDGKTRKKQEAFLERKGLQQAKLEDLAAAFVAHYVATGTDLFEGLYVRAVGGALYFNSYGLRVNVFNVDNSISFIAVASRALPASAEATAGKPELKN